MVIYRFSLSVLRFAPLESPKRESNNGNEHADRNDGSEVSHTVGIASTDLLIDPYFIHIDFEDNVQGRDRKSVV